MNIYDKFSMGATVRQLNEWTEAYDQGQPVVSDAEWDKLYFELKEAEEKLGFAFTNSPTQKVVYSVVNELKKVSHDEDYLMLSLDKTKDIADIENKFGNKQWVAMAKCDGLSCRLIYQGGRLIQAATRGNGEVGEDITHNAKVVKNIPKWIPHDGRLVVDGEDQRFAGSDSYIGGDPRCRNGAGGNLWFLQRVPKIRWLYHAGGTGNPNCGGSLYEGHGWPGNSGRQ